MSTSCDDRPVGYGGNAIPDSHLRRFSLRGAAPDAENDEPVDADLARFIRDQL